MPDSLQDVEGHDLGDLTEADVLDSPRLHNISLRDVCSSNASSNPTSNPGSGFPSGPVTPPNSFRDGGWFVGSEATLPSFNR